MADKDVNEASGAVSLAVPKIDKPKVKLPAVAVHHKKAKAKAAKKQEDPDLHSGRVGRIAIPDGKPAMIELAMKKGKMLSFRIASEEPARVAALLSLAGTALASGFKVHVRSVTTADNSLMLADLEIRAKH